MNQPATITSLALLCSLAAPSVAAQTYWEGSIAIEQKTAACNSSPASGLALNKPGPARLLLGANNASVTQLAVTGGDLAFLHGAIRFTGQFTPAAPRSYSGVYIYESAGFVSFNGTVTTTTMTPSTIAASTKNLVIRATINGFAGAAGCSLTVRGGFVR